jgi:hypothetical protein
MWDIMDLKNLDICFNRAIKLSFLKKKLLLTFFSLIICLFLFIFCFYLSKVIFFSKFFFIFLPYFLSFFILFILGIFLTEEYICDVKKIKKSFLKSLKEILNPINKSILISFSFVLVYLILFIIFSIFIFLNNIPHIGNIIGSFLTFIPFLIVMLVILLLLINVIVLFVVTPMITAANIKTFKIKDFFKSFQKNVFLNLLLFLIAITPFLFISFLLKISVNIINMSYLLNEGYISYFIKNFIFIILAAIFLTPAIIFFFNFAMEGYNLIKKEEK